MTERKTNPVQCLEKALILLAELARVPKDIDLKEVSRRANLSKSTASRLLATMEQRGIVRQNRLSRRFSLGPDLIRLGSIASDQLGLSELSHPFLEELMEVSGETTSLAILSNNQALYIDQVLSLSMIRSFPPVGTHIDLHCSAVGKVLLSELPPDQIQRVFQESGLAAYTENTITNPNQLLQLLEVVRKSGYAMDLEEKEIGGVCIAAPLRNYAGQIVAAVGISGPSNRITAEKLQSLAQRVVQAAKKASAQLGHALSDQRYSKLED
ncbi:MAG: IclR family transcriptional regulator [Coprothermobacterota bacterium]|nr:IclR family transcriptional regulator [Coprothermobacterota bacterium]